MPQAYYFDEDGTELWRSDHAEHVPPGSMITGPDGARYLAVRVVAMQELEGPQAGTLTFTLRPSSGSLRSV